ETDRSDREPVPGPKPGRPTDAAPVHVDGAGRRRNAPDATFAGEERASRRDARILGEERGLAPPADHGVAPEDEASSRAGHQQVERLHGTPPPKRIEKAIGPRSTRNTQGKTQPRSGISS